MRHYGEIVSKIAYQKGWSKVDLAKGLGITRQALYNQLDKADMKLSYIIQIGELIDVDFRDHIPELRKIIEETHSTEEQRGEYFTPVENPDPLEMMVKLDGTEETLKRVVERLKLINQSLSLG